MKNMGWTSYEIIFKYDKTDFHYFINENSTLHGEELNYFPEFRDNTMIPAFTTSI